MSESEQLPTECQCEPTDRWIYCPLMKRMMHPLRQAECQHKPHYFEMFLSEREQQPPRQGCSSGSCVVKAHEK